MSSSAESVEIVVVLVVVVAGMYLQSSTSVHLLSTLH